MIPLQNACAVKWKRERYEVKKEIVIATTKKNESGRVLSVTT